MKKELIQMIVLLSLFNSQYCINNVSAQPIYPETKICEVTDTIHGVEINDSYRWLENSSDEEVLSWDKAQNDYTDSYISKIPFRNKIQSKILGFYKTDDVSAPQKVLSGTRIFQYKKSPENEKWILYTQKDTNSPLEIILDPNKWDKDQTLSYFLPSRDGKYLAFGVSEGGNEIPKLNILDIDTGYLFPDTFKGWKQYINDWDPDGKGFYYSSYPLKGDVPEGEEYFWRSVYHHKLGTDSSEDILECFDDKVKDNNYTVYYSEDGRYLIKLLSRFYKNSIYFKKTGEKDYRTLTDSFDAEYSADIFQDKFYIWTNKNAPKGKICLADIGGGLFQSEWKDLIPETENGITGFGINNEHLYITYLRNACTRIRIFSPEGVYIKDLELPGLGSASVWGRQKYPTVWLEYTSFTQPSTIYKYSFEDGKLEKYFSPDYGINTDDFTTDQVWYNSKDGTKVSMFIVKKKGSVPEKNTPALMYGYGGFNVPITPEFSTVYSLWLESGGIVAIPNIRGGGEYGEEWHMSGTLEKKQNVFDDFIAAAEWLFKNNYTSAEKLAMAGGSNGGLLIGAVMTQRPDLMKAVYCGVPLLDMIRYHKSGLANIWKDEYGSAEDPEQFKFILKYSPYHNIKNGTKYPAAIITAGINDARVDPFHARKFTAAIRSANISDNPILIQVQQSSGHGGGTEFSTIAGQTADWLSFLMHQVGMVFGQNQL